MEILKKKDYDKYEMYGFRLNQKVLLNKKNKKGKILAIDTTGDDRFRFFVKDNEGHYCKDIAGCCGVNNALNKKGIWCRRDDISPIVEPVYFDIKEHMKKELSLCKEYSDEKSKYSEYKGRVFFVKASGKSELGFSDEDKLVEVEKEKDAEAVVIMLRNISSEIKHLLRVLMLLNPDNHTSILECVTSSQIASRSGSTDNLLHLLVADGLMEEYYGGYNKAVLIKI